MFNITPELLASGHKYRRELLATAFIALEPILAHMTKRIGIQGKESVGALTTGAELRPYRFSKDAKDTSDIYLRELETFLGDVVEEIDANALFSTVYATLVGEEPSESQVARAMAMEMAGAVGEALALSLFQAKRNKSGNKTKDLFNGFETILAAEKTAGNLSDAKANLFNMGSTNGTNAVDKLRLLYRNSHEVLRGKKSKMFISPDLYEDYNQCYLADFGSVPYNKEFNKTFLEGSRGLCELVPVIGTSGTRVILTTKDNMLVGMDQMGNTEKVEIRRPDNPKALQFFMLAYFGVEFESIDPRRICVGEYTA